MEQIQALISDLDKKVFKIETELNRKIMSRSGNQIDMFDIGASASNGQNGTSIDKALLAQRVDNMIDKVEELLHED